MPQGGGYKLVDASCTTGILGVMVRERSLRMPITRREFLQRSAVVGLVSRPSTATTARSWRPRSRTASTCTRRSRQVGYPDGFTRPTIPQMHDLERGLHDGFFERMGYRIDLRPLPVR